MSWVNPNEIEKIIKNLTNGIISDLELYDYDYNQQYKKELFIFFKKIFNKYGLLKTEFITTLDL